MRINNPEHNATFDLFWKTQPEPEEVFSPDMWQDNHFDELQSTVLVRCGFRTCTAVCHAPRRLVMHHDAFVICTNHDLSRPTWPVSTAPTPPRFTTGRLTQTASLFPTASSPRGPPFRTFSGTRPLYVQATRHHACIINWCAHWSACTWSVHAPVTVKSTLLHPGCDPRI